MTDLAEFQRTMEAVYGERDRARGVPATVAWLAEEVGELARAVRKGTADEQAHELGDVLAWLASLANQLGIDLDQALARYVAGCPQCRGNPRACCESKRDMSGATAACMGLAVAALAWPGPGAALLPVFRPRRPHEDPATSELRDEPPAVVNLITHQWNVTASAAAATLLDLANRGYVDIMQVSPEQEVV